MFIKNFNLNFFILTFGFLFFLIYNTGCAKDDALDTVPLETVPLDTMPLDTIPLDTIPLDTIPLDTIPLDTIPLDTIPLDTIPLDTIPIDIEIERILNDSFVCSTVSLSSCLIEYTLDIDLDGTEDIEIIFTKYTYDYESSSGCSLNLLNPDWRILSEETYDYFCIDSTVIGGNDLRFRKINCLESDNYTEFEINHYPLALTEQELANFAVDEFQNEQISIFHSSNNYDISVSGIVDFYRKGIKHKIMEGTYFVFGKNNNNNISYYGIKLIGDFPQYIDRSPQFYVERVVEL